MKIFGLNIDIKKFDRAFKSMPKKKDLETRPSRDWAILVLSFFALVTIIGASNYFIYKKAIEKVEADKVEPASENFDKNQMAKTLEFFDKKSENFNRLLNSSLNIKDPSI